MDRYINRQLDLRICKELPYIDHDQIQMQILRLLGGELKAMGNAK